VCYAPPYILTSAPQILTVFEYPLPKVHGGVRYLEKAVFNLDYGQLKLVFEALHERKRLLENAPHLTSALPIMTVGLLWAWLPRRTAHAAHLQRVRSFTALTGS
jgi:hypothetical protein